VRPLKGAITAERFSQAENIGTDLCILFKSNVTLGYKGTYNRNGAWLTATETLTARVARIEAEFTP
jgi:hypothetical protein